MYRMLESAFPLAAGVSAACHMTKPTGRREVSLVEMEGPESQRGGLEYGPLGQ